MKHQDRLSDTTPATRRAIASLWLALALLSSGSLAAQTPSYLSALGVGGSGAESGSSIATDGSGNRYVTGFFNGTVDFDPGAGTTSLTAVDTGTAFVAKYDNANNLVWAFRLGGTGNGTLANWGHSIAVASNGDVLVMGEFSGSADFNPGAGTTTLTARTGNVDLFLARYTSAGNFLWAFNLPVSPGNLYSRHHTMALDRQGNIVLVGYFYATVDFDPGSRRNNVSAASTAAGCSDIFVAKYNSAGGHLWAFRVGSSTDFEAAEAVAIDRSDNIIICGVFGLNGATVDFNPASRGTANVVPPAGRDIFVGKYSPNGQYLWAFAVGGTGNDRAIAITADAQNNVVLTGFIEDTVDFDPGAGISAVSELRNLRTTFLARYDSSGRYRWAFRLGAGWGASLASDADGNIFVTGSISGKADFDPGADSAILSTYPGGYYNCFVASYTPAGAYRYAFGVPGTGSDSMSVSHGNAITIGSNTDFLLTGDFGLNARGTSDFDPGQDTARMTTAGDFDLFVAHYEEVTLPKRLVRTGTGGAIHIAPNPFTGAFTLRSDGAAGPSRIQIADMMGRIVETREIADAGQEVVLGSQLPPGSYMVQIIQGDERRTTMIHKVK